MPGTSGDDSLVGTAGNDTLEGLGGNDTLEGLAGNDSLDGGDGDDTIDGGDDGDFIKGGLGVDTLTGGAGADRFIFSNLADTGLLTPDIITDFDGDDTITFGQVFDSVKTVDPFFFVGTGAFTGTANEIRYFTGGGITTIEVDADGDGSADHRVEITNGEFALREGAPYTGNIQIDDVNLTATAGDDIIEGTSGADTVDGLAGNDAFNGFGGADVFNGGDGDDSFEIGNGNDTIDGGAGTFDTVNYQSFGAFDLVITDSSITNLVDGTVVTISNIETFSTSRRWTPAFDDRFDASASSMTIQIFGGRGNDTLIGGSGDDFIEGDVGADISTGGTGADIFDFDFIEELSTTPDIVTDLEPVDTLDFNGLAIQFLDPADLPNLVFIGSGAFTGAAQELRYTKNASDTVVEIDVDGDMVADLVVNVTNGGFDLQETFVGSLRLQIVSDAAATAGDDSLVGTNGDDTIDGLAGNDTILGLAGNDNLLGGDDDDDIEGGDGDDTLDGGDGDDFLFGGEGTDFLFGGAGADTVNGGAGDQFLFGGDDGDIISGGDGFDRLEGEAGDDSLDGGDGDDRLEGGAGVDTMTGGAGCDVFSFLDLTSAGASPDVITDFAAGDLIRLGETGGTSKDPGADLLTFIGTAAFSNTAGEFRYTTGGGITTIEVDVDGDGASDQTINITNGEFDLRTTINNGPSLEIDVAFGATTADDDKIYGGPGAANDTINGGDGNDNLRGMAGDDVVNGGDGDDFISEHLGNDTIDGGAGFDELSRFYGAPASVVITDSFITNGVTGEIDSISNIERIFISNRLAPASDDTIQGAIATIELNLHAGAGDDVVIGGSNNDNIEGDVGDDTLTGGAGADTFDFDYTQEIGTGGDEITDLEVGDLIDFSFINLLGEIADPDGLDLVFIGENAFTGAVGEFRSERSGGQTQIQFDEDGDGTGDRFVTITNGEFVLVETAVNSAILEINAATPTPGDDFLTGTNGDDTIDGLGGNDTILGLDGNDVLDGNDGNDTIEGGDGDDAITGGAGVDTMTGGAGCDFFAFTDLSHAGTTPDVITDFEAGDLIQLGATSGTSRDPGADLLVFIGTAAFSGAVGEFRYSTGGGVTTIEVDSDGDASADHVIQITNGEFDLRTTINNGPSLEIDTAFGVATAGDDKLFGSSGDDTIDGGDGADNIRGMAGNDSIIGGDGDDFISENTGNDTIDGGAGNDSLTHFYGEAINLTITDSSMVNSLTGETDSISNIEMIFVSNRLAPTSDDTIDGSAATIALNLHAGAGDDIVIGGVNDDNVEGDVGADTLTGGLGADTFDVDYLQEVSTTADVFVDFEPLDTLDLATIQLLFDVGDPEGADITFIGNAAFSGTAGEYRYETMAMSTQVQIDEDGDGAADRFINMTNGVFTLTETSPNRIQIVAGSLTSGADDFVGSNDDDVINGVGGADFIQSLHGDDTINAGGGNDSVLGGDGDDSIAGAGQNDTLRGGDGVDTLSGGGGADAAFGDAGNDELFGGSGSDTLVGGDDNDTLSGGDGADSLSGQDGDDEFFGGNGSDTIIGGAGNDSMTGVAGNDELFGGTGFDTLFGGNDNDTLAGNDDDDELFGNQGDDRLFGGGGNDFVVGGNGADFMTGFTGDDFVAGGLGDDVAFGGGGNDTVLGGDDNDDLSGNQGDDELFGGDGDDTAAGGNDNDLVAGADGNDLLTGNTGDDTVIGGSGIDTVIGGNGADSLVGNQGNDDLFGGQGNDTLNAGNDDDLLAGNAGDDSLLGGAGADTLNGGGDNDVLNGGNGADELFGTSGDDTLIGGGGNDTMLGGNGDDLFVFSAGSGVDEINGFVAGAATDDVIELSGYGAGLDDFADVLAAGSDVGGNFVLDLGGGESLTLNGVIEANLDVDDFIFS